MALTAVRHTHSGNRCGHSPTTPNFLVQRAAGNLPKFLQRVIANVEGLYSRLFEIAELDTLNGCRKKRSERREAITQTLKALLKYTDLASLTVGIPGEKGLVGLTLKRLHKETTISWPRFKRAIADLRRASLISITQPRTTNRAGEVRGLCAVKAVAVKLFRAMRLDRVLKKERNKASARQAKKAASLGITRPALYRLKPCTTPRAETPMPTPAPGQSFGAYVAQQRRR